MRLIGLGMLKKLSAVVTVFQILLVEIKGRIKQLGTKPLCNGRADRAPRLMGVCFPFCWRCTGIIAGLTAFYAAPHDFLIFRNDYLTAMMLIPIFADGIRQYGFKIESSNPVRFITGVLAGISTGIFESAM